MMVNSMGAATLGVDLSVGHVGYCVIKSSGREKRTVWAGFSHELKKYDVKQERLFNQHTSNRLALVKKNHNGKRNRQLLQAERMLIWHDWVGDMINEASSHGVGHVIIEDYAYAATTNSAAQQAEIGGVVRLRFLLRGYKVRTVMPSQLAKWIGHCPTKKERCAAAVKMDFPIIKPAEKAKLVSLKKTKHGQDYDGPLTDMVDAFFLADMLQWELALRTGRCTAQDLTDRQREVFNATSPAMPENLLERPFLTFADLPW